MDRLVDGDYSGANTYACGAVDFMTQQIYEKYALGDPGKVSFQAKVNTALKRLRVFEEMGQEFKDLDMNQADASLIVNELREAINHAAQVL